MSNKPAPELLPLYPILYEETVRRALLEDLGRAGDATTDAIAFPGDTAAGMVVSRAPGRTAGIDVCACAFKSLDPGVEIEIKIPDGSDVQPGDTLAVISGAARPILSGERTALNFLMRLSGIATVTREVVRLVAGYPAKVVCTRKTTPGLRALEKYAVRAGGGSNHRFGLDDAVLIKDNHVVVAGSITEAIQRVRRRVGHMVKVEVEVDTLEQLELALREKVDAVLLDNMSVDTLSQAVRMAKGKAVTEASGRITPQTAPAIAATGVDLISFGWITHSAPSLDLGLDFKIRD